MKASNIRQIELRNVTRTISSDNKTKLALRILLNLKKRSKNVSEQKNLKKSCRTRFVDEKVSFEDTDKLFKRILLLCF